MTPTPILARLIAAALVLGSTACLAPAPPIVVDTPYGEVRAGSTDTANEVAGLLARLAPAVRDLLPGSQDRAIDVWVQDELQVYRFSKRPEAVRGFTLLSDEFEARRIHLQAQGQSPWYLAHELVHALIGKSWSALPGILEEGLADVIAERLNKEYSAHIRAHRLLNATAFSDGLRVELAFRMPDGMGSSSGIDFRRGLRLRLTESVAPETALELLSTSRAELHDHWPEIPESYYGIAWLVVSRICDRRSIEGLHELCERAANEGYDLVPAAWLLEAAEIDLERFDAEFVASCFTRYELQRAIYLQPEAFAQLAIEGLRPLHGRLDSRQLFLLARPSFYVNGARIPLSTIGPVKEAIKTSWGR